MDDRERLNEYSREELIITYENFDGGVDKSDTNEELIEKILEQHKLWLKKSGGKRADLSGASLRNTNLRNTNLRNTNLRNTNLRNTNLRNADLSGADLSWANLSGADLSRANLSSASLSNADLSGANLRKADLSWANLSSASLSNADLSWANLSNADLRNAELSGANLRNADLSGADGLIDTINYLNAHFDHDLFGYYAYKTFGGQYMPKADWKIECGSVISENVNVNRADVCGCGINVAPLNWVKLNYKGDIWKVLIRWEWACGIVVPYNTDGKIRCERCELVEIVN